jgi:hypothetical protein
LAGRWGFEVVETMFLFVNPDDLESGSKVEYLKLIYLSLGGKNPSLDYPQLVRDIRDLIKKKNKSVVIFLRAFNYLDFADKNFWGSFRSIISGLENISVVFITYCGGYDIGNDRFSRISDLLGQNIVRLDKLSDTDVSYLIERWEYIFGRKYSELEVKAIRKVSCGRPMLIKPCCSVLANISIHENPKSFLLENNSIQHVRYPNRISIVGDRVNAGTMNVTHLFSDQETSVLKLFYSSIGKIVSKDEIASTLWKSRVLEKYSESAISQLIRRIRDKILLLDIPRDTIQTAHGKGYIFREG